MKKIVISLAVFLGTGIFGYARTYYVRPDGNDTNSGLANTPTEAWKTISQAVKNLKPGDVVEVQEGTYQGGIVVDVRGEEKQPITLRATGNVVINTTNEGYNKYCLSIRGCYIHLEGFDLSGGNYWGGSVFLWAGSHHNVIRNNTIHHSSTGVGLWQSDENLIVQNKFYNNSGNAIFIYHSSDPGYSDNNIIARNLFYDNGVAIRVARAKGTKIVGNIIYGSSSSGIYLSGEECGNAKYLTTETLIEHNIVANIPRNKNAVGIYQAEVVTKTELKCNDVWGNEKRNYSGLDPGGTDISEDPMFVAPEEKRFDLKEESPCFKKGIYPPPAVSKNTAEKEKWGLLAEYLDEEFQIKGVCLTPAIGKEGIDLTVRINVSSRQDVARALLKMEIVRGGSQFSPAPRDVSLKKGDNTLEVTLSLPETPGPGSSVKVCFLNREGKEMMTGIFPIIGADCLRIRMEKPSYRNTLFTSQTDKDVVVRVAIDGKEENLKNKKLNFLIRDSTGKEKFLLLEKEPVQGKRYTFSGGTFPPGKYAIVAHLVSG
ncbi:MAG TPA: right-handed parallel beta-helix repeat-containing protein, partial [bacterium]|nr:right-handed parallel beta-helix repeat-containing protein [bacterium]